MEFYKLKAGVSIAYGALVARIETILDGWSGG